METELYREACVEHAPLPPLLLSCQKLLRATDNLEILSKILTRAPHGPLGGGKDRWVSNFLLGGNCQCADRDVTDETPTARMRLNQTTACANASSASPGRAKSFSQFPNLGLNLMSETALELLRTFETLPPVEQHELLVALLRRGGELPDTILTDDQLVGLADDLFQHLDGDEEDGTDADAG